MIQGRNSRLDTIQSAVLNIRLSSYNEIIKKRNNNANIYKKELNDINGLVLPAEKKNTYNAYHQFVIRLNKRNQLRNFLKQKGSKLSTVIKATKRRDSVCWSCHDTVDNKFDYECGACGWIICSNCGACKQFGC